MTPHHLKSGTMDCLKNQSCLEEDSPAERQFWENGDVNLVDKQETKDYVRANYIIEKYPDKEGKFTCHELLYKDDGQVVTKLLIRY